MKKNYPTQSLKKKTILSEKDNISKRITEEKINVNNKPPIFLFNKFLNKTNNNFNNLPTLTIVSSLKHQSINVLMSSGKLILKVYIAKNLQKKIKAY